MNNTIIWLAIIGIASLLVLFSMTFPRLKQIALIRRTPGGYISAFPYDGQVKVSGKTGPAVAESIITETDCAFWQVEIEERRGGKNSHWVSLLKRTSPEPFEVLDESSRIVVQPEGATLVMRTDMQKSGGLFSNLDQSMLDKIESLGVETTGTFGFKKTLRVSERFILPGEPVFVLGQIKIVDGRRQIVGSQEDSLIISDRVEAELLRWLYGQAVLWLVLIPLGVVLIAWLFLGNLGQ